MITDTNLFTLCNCILKTENAYACVFKSYFMDYDTGMFKVRCYVIILEFVDIKTVVVIGF